MRVPTARASPALRDELLGLGEVIVHDRLPGGGQGRDAVRVEVPADLVDGVVEGSAARRLRGPARRVLAAPSVAILRKQLEAIRVEVKCTQLLFKSNRLLFIANGAALQQGEAGACLYVNDLVSVVQMSCTS